MKKIITFSFFLFTFYFAFGITATKAYVDSATNATLTASKQYTDAAVVAAGAVTPSIATNISATVTSNIVTKSYVEDLGISGGGGCDTNAVNEIISTYNETNLVDRFGTKVNACIVSTLLKTSGVETCYIELIHSDITADSKATIANLKKITTVRYWYNLDWGMTYKDIPIVETNNVLNPNIVASNSYGKIVIYAPRAFLSENKWQSVYAVASNLYGYQKYTYFKFSDFTYDTAVAGNAAKFDGHTYTETLSTVASSVTTATNATLAAAKAAADVAYYPKTSGNTLASTVGQWEDYWGGSNVCWEVTNYYGIVDVPKLRLLELRDGTYREVWNDITKFETFQTNVMANIVTFCNTNVQPKLDAKADKAWGKYTSAGSAAPTNMVWHTAPTTVFAGGYEYTRYAVGSGAIAVLTSKGAPTYTSGDEGKFRIGDDGGTNYFGFAKSDSYTIATRTDGISVSGQAVTLKYDTVGETYPILYYTSTLSSSSTWEQLNNADGTPITGATYAPTFVTHTDYVSATMNVGSAPQGFFKAETTVLGKAIFETNMQANLMGGIVCTNTSTGVSGVIRPTYNGSSVSWTWSAR